MTNGKGTAAPALQATVRIDRCVCFGRSFAELHAIAVRTHCRTLEELQEETEFGLSCRLCNPYVRRMLATGETLFSELIDDAPPPDEGG